ncbi:MAG: hypothetical protein L6R40_005007 [Gallowayella cf. fulva]|nr:MAG: hypothetical protein L6R40_005007 [Xanthomendoza cf. fulva]
MTTTRIPFGEQDVLLSDGRCFSPDAAADDLLTPGPGENATTRQRLFQQWRLRPLLYENGRARLGALSPVPEGLVVLPKSLSLLDKTSSNGCLQFPDGHVLRYTGSTPHLVDDRVNIRTERLEGPVGAFRSAVGPGPSRTQAIGGTLGTGALVTATGAQRVGGPSVLERRYQYTFTIERASGPLTAKVPEDVTLP